MRKTLWIVAVITILLVINPTFTEAQFRPDHNAPTITQKIGIPYSPSNSTLVLGFIDPSRLNMQQSYSVSFASGGRQSGALGFYTNRLTYMISPKMQLIADIGILHQPFQGAGDLPLNLDNGQFFYGGELRYKPTENSMLSIRLDNMPRPYYYNDYYYGNRYYRDSFYPYSPYFGY